MGCSDSSATANAELTNNPENEYENNLKGQKGDESPFKN